jgi:hypothetical protein
MTTTTAPERARLTLAETAADTRVMAARQLRKVMRRPAYVSSGAPRPTSRRTPSHSSPCC